jgi:hypothetical protein
VGVAAGVGAASTLAGVDGVTTGTAALAPGVHPVGAHCAAARWLAEPRAQVAVTSARTRKCFNEIMVSFSLLILG